MYFHLIWIKENNWVQNDLDLLIQWWDESFIRKFLWHRWVVIVSINEFKEDAQSFWNIMISVLYENTEIQMLITGENLQDVAYLYTSLWLSLHFINFIKSPVSDWEVQEIIESASNRIQEEHERIKREQEEKELAEKKKYSESAIDDTLKIVNFEIDHIDQVIKAWNWIVSLADMKKLEDLCNELKKIRLWTNFNKMAYLVLSAQKLTKKAEEEILSQSDWKVFLIDRNSITTNIDFISELSEFNRISEKSVVQSGWLTTSESIRNMLWLNSVFLRMLMKDFFHTFKESSIEECFWITMEFVEFIILIVIVLFSFLWLIDPLFWIGKFSLYLLPASWWLGLLVFLFNNLKLKWIMSKVVWFAVLAIIYRYWLILLKGTFAL